MFITNKNFKIQDNKSVSLEMRDKAGIVDCRRVVHVFYDEKNPLTCKVIQISVSTTKGTHILFDNTFMNRNNGCISFIAVYTYDCKLNTAYQTLKEKFLYGTLSIISAKRSNRETDMDNNYTRDDIAQLHSKVFSKYKLSDNVCSKELVSPKFYTEEHEYAITGDRSFGISNMIYDIVLHGYDIVDDITEIYKQDPILFDKVNNSLNNNQFIHEDIQSYNRSSPIISAEDSITEINYITGYDSFINGGIFVYDSQYGMNVKDAAILCKNYLTKQAASIELETMMTVLESVGKSIEKDCGSIRLMYNPSLLGSKCRIIYRDFKNAISDSGLKDSLSSKSSDQEVTETISRCIDNDDSLFAHEEILEDVHYTGFQKEKIESYFR